MKAKYLPYNELIERARKSSISQENISSSSYVSFFLPTLKFNEPCFVAFICPMALKGDANYGNIENIWIIKASNGTLYNFIDGNDEISVDIEKGTQEEKNISNLLALEEELKNEMPKISRAFFTGVELKTEIRGDFRTTLLAFLDSSLIPYYSKTAPDFWEWLNKN